MKSTNGLTLSIYHRRVNAGGNRAGERFSSSSQPSPTDFEILSDEAQQN